MSEIDIDPRSDEFYKMWRKGEIEMTEKIIGPGPFFCSFCGRQMIEAGHMTTKFFLCPDAGEFTWSPPDWVRVEVNGTSYVVGDRAMTAEELKQQRSYYEMCADAHKRSAESRKTEIVDTKIERERRDNVF